MQRAVSMITTPVFTRLMTTDEYGRLGSFYSWHGILSIVISLFLYYGVHPQGLVKFSERREEFTSSLLGLSTAMVTFWTVIYLLFRDFWNDIFSLTTTQVLLLMVLIWTASVFNLWANHKRVTYSYRPLVAVTLIASLSRPAVEIVFVFYADDKVTARILGWVIAELAIYSWMMVYHMSKGKKFFSAYFWKYALIFNLPLVPHYLSQMVLNRADLIMIKKMVGDSEAGIYNLAYVLAAIFTFFNAALIQTVSPWMYGKIKEKDYKGFAPICYSTFIMVAVINLLLITGAPEIIAIFAPETYSDAVMIVTPVALSVLFQYAYEFFSLYALYYEKTRTVMVLSTLVAVSNVVLNFLLIPRFGYVAAGYTTLFCYAVFALVHYCLMRKICRDCCGGIYPYDTRIIILISGLFIAAGFAVSLTYPYPFVRYGILAAVMVAALIMRRTIVSSIKSLLALRKNSGEVQMSDDNDKINK
ncbi:MAG: oligosaccharide flippase family protein [Clostridiales bacterium]|nr:oligosaccharide flippase family protein [Clostridiales bacterium]